MKNILFLFLLTYTISASAQSAEENLAEKAIHTLIDQYAHARATQDTTLLRSILTEDVDQLVSSGTWRRGMQAAMQGMQQSSSNNPGERILTIEHIRFLSPENAIVDARYEIHQTDGNVRKMWSTFVVVAESGQWKIAAIRNMLPAKRR